MIWTPSIPTIITPGKWRFPRDGGLARGISYLHRCCCPSTCTIDPFHPSGAAPPCLLGALGSFNICISNEAGDGAVLNTGGTPVVLTKDTIFTDLFQYIEAGVRRIDYEFDFDANGYETVTLTTYVWSGAAWVLWRTTADGYGSLTGGTSTVHTTTTQVNVDIAQYTVLPRNVGNSFIISGGTATPGTYTITAVDVANNRFTLSASAGTAGQTVVGGFSINENAPYFATSHFSITYGGAGYPAGYGINSVFPRSLSSDWTSARTISVTFSGINYVLIASACADGNFHISGNLNGKTYSGPIPSMAPPYYPAISAFAASGDMTLTVTDPTVIAFTGGSGNINDVLVYVAPTAPPDPRGFGVVVSANDAVGGHAPYFSGKMALGSGNCQGSHTVNNDIVAACQLVSGNRAVGYLGSAIVTIS